jgi:LCP family protein required for cell wall assembly
MKNIDSLNKENSGAINSPRINSSDRPQSVQHISLLSRTPNKKPRKWLKAAIGILLIIMVIGGSAFVSKAINLSNKIFVGQKTSFFQKLRQFISGGNGSVPLIGENLGQVNVLILGIGGEGHDGPYLTDTIILAQLRPDTNEAVLTSIPRDYLVNLPNNLGGRKMNAAFAEGFSRNKDWNEAGTWARETVEKLSGLSIPYFAVVDFSGFEKAVDEIGGVDIKIDHTFTDYLYPDNGTGYLPPLTFKEGAAHLNGKRALQFARSRHALGPEGSDFARSQRQQKIIQAFKSKVIGLNLVTDAGKLTNLLSVFADHFHTNINPGEMLRIYSIVKEHNIQTIYSLSLDPETKIICPEILESNGAYVLTPCPGKTASDVQDFFKNAFFIGKLTYEKSVVWLASSTGNRQAYRTALRKLTGAGLAVLELPYGKSPLTQTVEYGVNPKPTTMDFIKSNLQALEVTVPPPGIKVSPDKVDVIVILGENALVEPDPVYIKPATPKASSTPEVPASTTPSLGAPAPESGIQNLPGLQIQQ